jgi:Uma2 family endonuclease
MDARNDHVPAPDIRLTYAELALLPDDGKRHELIDGAHFVTPSPGRRHQAVVWNLTVLIGSYLNAHPVGRAFAAPFDVVFSELDVVEPDLLFVSTARQDVLTPKHVRGAPDLVVEVGSPTTRKRDETIKRRLYERFGVAEYWIIDPELDSISVYRRTPAGYVLIEELLLSRGDSLTTPLLPGLGLPLAQVFRD